MSAVKFKRMLEENKKVKKVKCPKCDDMGYQIALKEMEKIECEGFRYSLNKLNDCLMELYEKNTEKENEIEALIKVFKKRKKHKNTNCDG